GHDLIDGKALGALIRKLFPLASVVTPNALEAERITNIPISDLPSMQKAAEVILALGPRSALVKGGDLDTDTATDLMIDRDGFALNSTQRVPSKDTHGTGCTLAAALACLLARGFSLREAIP